MGEYNSLVSLKQYGKIRFKFQDVMDEMGVNRNMLAKAAGIRFEVADRFYHGRIERLDIDVLCRVCQVLDCQVGDVMVFEKAAIPES